MRKILSGILILSCFISCKKESSLHKLTAIVNGKRIQMDAVNLFRYTDKKNDKAFRYFYKLEHLSGSPLISIEIIDSTFFCKKFDFSKLSVKYSIIDSIGYTRTYDAIAGELNIDKEIEDNLIGNFNFVLIDKSNTIDTLVIQDGFFEITMVKYNRIWDNTLR